mgnify:CR=1 FL=1
MRIYQSLNQKQILTLKQVLSPKIIQMLKTFQLPYSDLLSSIKNEVNENVTLDIIQYDQLSNYSIKSMGSSDTDFTEIGRAHV